MADVYANPKTNTLYFHSEVDSQSIFQAIVLFDELKTSGRPIHFYINSFGGSVPDMWALIHTIETSPVPVYTYCTGYAYSAAFIIFISGTRRYIGPNAELMCHSPSWGTYGKSQEMYEGAVHIVHINKRIESYVLRHTKIRPTKLDEVREHKLDWYITPDEAITYGCADEILKGV